MINGKLLKLNVKEGDLVNDGDIIAYMESTADHSALIELSNALDSILALLEDNQVNSVPKYFLGTSNELGEMQGAYENFVGSLLSFTDYLNDGFYMQKQSLLAQDMLNLVESNRILLSQMELYEEDLMLTEKTFDANQLLKNNEIISDFDYRAEKSKLINKRLVLPQLREAIISNRTQQNAKQKEILELKKTIIQQKIIFQAALNTFKSQLDEWIRKYCVLAPISGRIAFVSFIQENQQLKAGESICFINPDNSEYFAIATVSQYNFGKLTLDQVALLKFDSYPFQEYGAVEGRVSFISHIPNSTNDSDGYTIKIDLPNGLTTTHKKNLQYSDGLQANVEIITKDMRLIERFYFNLIKQLNQ